jgi:LPXTG-site transpeptidase (sortase) family protein
MRPKGTIYRKGKSPLKGEVRIYLPFLTRLMYRSFQGVGAGLIAVVVILFAMSFTPIIEQEINFRLKKEEDVVIRNQMLVNLAEADKVVEVQKEAENYGVGSYFSVVVPKIEAASDIVVNVDTSDKEEYLDALRKGVAHAKGTYFPGQGENIFLFAHSTDSPVNYSRYNAIFYLLRKLEEGDNVIVYFADKKYIYEVDDKFTTNIDDTTWITESIGDERLLLMTCDPPGTTWRRLIISAKRVGQAI